MAITHVESLVTLEENGSTPSGDIGTNFAADDYALVWIGQVAVTFTVTTPATGWDLLAGPTSNTGTGDVRAALFGRRLQAGDTNPTWTMSLSGDYGISTSIYRGVDTTTAIDGTPSIIGRGSAASQDTGSVTTSGAATLVSGVAIDTATSVADRFTEPSLSTKRVDATVSGDLVGLGVADKAEAASGTFTHTWGLDVADFAVLFLVALKPAAGAATPTVPRPTVISQAVNRAATI